MHRERWQAVHKSSDPSFCGLRAGVTKQPVRQIRAGLDAADESMRPIRVFTRAEYNEAHAAVDVLSDFGIVATVFGHDIAQTPGPPEMTWTDDLILLVDDAVADQAAMALAAAGLGMSLEDRVQEVVQPERDRAKKQFLAAVSWTFVVLGLLFVLPIPPDHPTGIFLLAVGISLLAFQKMIRGRRKGSA